MIFLHLMRQLQLAVPLVHKDHFIVPDLLRSGGLPPYNVEPKGVMYLSFFMQPSDIHSAGGT